MKTLIVTLVLFSTQAFADLIGKNLLCKPRLGVDTILLALDGYSIEQQKTAQKAELIYVGISFTSEEDIEYHLLFEDNYETQNLIYDEYDSTISFQKKVEPCTNCLTNFNEDLPRGSINRQNLSMMISFPNDNIIGQSMICEIVDLKEDLKTRIDNLFNLKRDHYKDIRNMKLKKNKI